MRSIVALLAIISCFVGVNLQSTNANPRNANLFELFLASLPNKLSGANTTAGNINSGANTTTGNTNSGANTTTGNTNSGANTTPGNTNSVPNATPGNTNSGSNTTPGNTNSGLNPNFGANANLFLQLLSTFESTSDAILDTVQAVLGDLISGTTGTLNNSSNTVKDIILAAGNQTETLLSQLIQLFKGSPQQSIPQIIPTFT